MKRTRLGQTDLEISRVVFGSMIRRPSSESDQIRVIQAAIDSGMTTIDTAPLYDFGTTEEVVGKSIRGRRHDVEILSKVGLRWDDEHGDILFEFTDDSGVRRAVRRDSRPAAIRKDVEESLGRLGTDRIDLCQIHQPDPSVPIAESLGELDRLIHEGKILHVGVSNFSGPEIEATLEGISRMQPACHLASDQLHYSLLNRSAEDEIRPLAQRHGFGLLAYSPLEAGALTDAMLTPDLLDLATRARSPVFRPGNAIPIQAALHECVQPVAVRHGMNVSQVCLAWLLQQDHVAGVIAGASNVDQVQANSAASEIMLEPDELDSIERRFATLRIDPMAGEDWQSRVNHFLRRARRKLGRILRGD